MELLYHDEVKIFIKKLEKSSRSKVIRGAELIELYGYQLGMPHVKRLTRELHELRIRGQQEVRILFVVQRNKVILIHGFVKKTQKTPIKEIQTAEKRLRQLTEI